MAGGQLGLGDTKSHRPFGLFAEPVTRAQTRFGRGFAKTRFDSASPARRQAEWPVRFCVPRPSCPPAIIAT